MNFGLSQQECDKVKLWFYDLNIHPKCQDTEGKTAIGGALTYKFTPTNIGTITQVVCGVCKNYIDLTDYDNW